MGLDPITKTVTKKITAFIPYGYTDEQAIYLADFASWTDENGAPHSEQLGAHLCHTYSAADLAAWVATLETPIAMPADNSPAETYAYLCRMAYPFLEWLVANGKIVL